MLPAANRLRSAADFRETTRRGTTVSRGCVVVYLAPGDPLLPARAGVVVSKVVGGSVERHRAARRIRGSVAPLLAALPAGSRLVVRALAGADTAPGLQDDVTRAVTRALERRASPPPRASAWT